MFEIYWYFSTVKRFTKPSNLKRTLCFLWKSWTYILGFMALLWFIIRVIPKPSRATYPCQRFAFPIASAFVLWITATFFSFKFFRDARSLIRRKRAPGAVALLLTGVVLLALSNLAFPAKSLLAGIMESAAEAPVMVKGYSVEADSYILPAATVGMVKSETENVFEISYNELEQMVREAVAMAGGLEGLISDGNTVVLKPNIVIDNFLGTELPIEANGMVTDWRVVSVVAKMVRELNPNGKILVIEGSAAESTMGAYVLLNYTKDAIPEVDEFIAIEDNSGAWHDTKSDDLRSALVPAGKALYPDFKLPNGSAPYYYNKQYFEADVFISLPVLKNHESAGVTGAVKNMGIGGTPSNIYGNSENINGRWEVINHSASELHKFIHDFYYGRPADFAIMDGIQGYSNGPNTNNGPRYLEGHWEGMGLILASADPLAMDAIASLVMFHDPTLVPYLVYLNNDGFGCADPMAIRVEGSLVSDVKKPFAHENHATVCAYTDATPPGASIDQLLVEDQVLRIVLSDTAGLARVDLQVDGQFLDRFIIGNFGNIEVDLASFELSDSLVTLFTHDRYMNSRKLTAKIDGTNTTGLINRRSTVIPTLYPNPAVASVTVRMTMQQSGQVISSLYNLSGQLVAEQENLVEAGQAEIVFKLSEAPAGNYILVVLAGHERHSMPVIVL